MNKLVIISVVLFIMCFSSSASCEIIKSDAVWSGEVSVTENILVPEGVVLTILPGTVVQVALSESARTAPEYMTYLTGITVRGTIRAGSKGGTPVVFAFSGKDRAEGWAGIMVDGGTLVLNSCRIQDAESGVYVLRGAVDIQDTVLEKNRYAFTVQGPDAKVSMENTKIHENDYGVILLNGAQFDSKNNLVKGNLKKNSYISKTGKYLPSVKEYKSAKKTKIRVYENEALLGTTIWDGLVYVNGVVRVPEKNRLIIMQGTVVEFTKKDTNKDGIGENGILIQGVLIAKGTRDNPIIFRSAEKENKMGDWDAINIMNSDGAQNLIEYCQIEDAYRGLHSHFSNVAVKHAVLRNNYRGIQFQESTVEISGSFIYGNKSGLQARDSEIIFTDNDIYNNFFGLSMFRVNGIVKSNRIAANYRDGVRIREGVPIMEENFIAGNRYGLSLSHSVFGGVSRNVIFNNFESGITLKEADNIAIKNNFIQGNGLTGIALKGTDNITTENNFIQGNGLNGISVLDSRAVIKGNHISENGDRGIGIISFEGTITGNNFIKNGRYAIGLDGPMEIKDTMNWWGGAVIEDVIYDRNDDPQRGKINYKEPSASPIPYTWPINNVYTNTAWHGEIHIKDNLTVTPDARLSVAPGTKVVFSKDVGLMVKGVIEAAGEKDARIVFTRVEKTGDALWDGILVEQAKGTFSNCDFEYAAMALHSHFSHLKVTGCRFRSNTVGMAFRGGPVEIRQSVYEGNSTGLRPYFAKALIAENVIAKNEIGIFVRDEKAKGLTITKNNIYSNSKYNMRLGDLNREDVDAKDNWWGEGTPASTIYDEKDEPEIGAVIYEPYAEKPFKLDTPALTVNINP